MPTRTCDALPRKRTLCVVATALTAASLCVAGCTRSSDQPNDAGSSSTSVPQSASIPTQRQTAAPTGPANNPVDVAKQWLFAYHSMSWTDAGPSAWISRVRPYVTAALDAQDQQYADAPGGQDWQDFVAKHCSRALTDLGAVIPSESPGTSTEVNVQVTGTITTICDAGEPDSPAEAVSATLVVLEEPDTTWHVNQRLH